MSLPRVLKNYDVSQNGSNWIGKVSSVTLPKITMKTEDIVTGGLAAALEAKMGFEKLELSFSSPGYLREALRAVAATTVDAVPLRFTGAYQDDSTGLYDSVEFFVRGRYKEVDPGEAKAQTVSEWKYTMPLAYYRLTINNEVIHEIDVLGNVCIIDGIDVLAAERAAMGRW